MVPTRSSMDEEAERAAPEPIQPLTPRQEARVLRHFLQRIAAACESLRLNFKVRVCPAHAMPVPHRPP